ncbi:glycoside hydrolase family 66 protein [Arthrobacter sp. CJ23]|uniref:glycoside hydrolase family 66 protein n=1 Tax=Arthrobacter sp. CJ23 TaxID=2972479 RepID=UPI00215D1E82|nr:glycoside hydrolase family 66 protein [Arthrobacter sp. CJ23]UVJ38635.1 hypothetical protein NVV90_15600 [Arthrobacter sp. CJ23]
MLRTWHLGELLSEVTPADDGVLSLGPLPSGGYGIELTTSTGTARTGVLVTDNPRSRLRYGFVASYTPDRDINAVLENVRRLHLNGIQFYDWAYRHADLLGGGEDYRDALDQPVSLATVRKLIEELGNTGTDAIGYAAVYAVGPQEWDQWKHAALLQADGQPYGLGDFLNIIDPADPQWIEHFAKELNRSVEEVGFHGFHLDQYGYPRRAVLPDGKEVDLSESFPTVIDASRRGAPGARLVFNNVNDFPTWATAATDQDAIYIEVWAPHTTLGSLAKVVTRARAASAEKPIVIAAYQHVYDSAPAAESDTATAYTMATLFSHGATQLLAGEADRILVDPYYVRNHKTAPSTQSLLQRWYDYLVEHDELLLNPATVEVTGAWVGDYNEALDVHFEDTPVTEEPTPGAVWRRVTEIDGKLVLHLINLAGQDHTLWDAARPAPAPIGSGTLRLRTTGNRLPRVRVADPDRCARLTDVHVTADGEYAIAHLPEPHIWQTVLVEP